MLSVLKTIGTRVIIMITGLWLLSGCATVAYQAAFDACDQRVGACYRNCDQYEGDEDAYRSCLASCEAEASACFDRAYNKLSSQYCLFYCCLCRSLVWHLLRLVSGPRGLSRALGIMAGRILGTDVAAIGQGVSIVPAIDISAPEDRSVAADHARDDPNFRDRRNPRPRGDRPRRNRPRGDRPRNDRPRSDRPRRDRPRVDRPRGDRPRGDKAEK